jgi:hypothetical protein
MNSEKAEASTRTADGLSDVETEKLAANLRGWLLRPGVEGFDAARRVWNAMIDRTPALIARCAGAADVVRCVNLRAITGCLSPCAAAGTTCPEMPCATAA